MSYDNCKFNIDVCLKNVSFVWGCSSVGRITNQPSQWLMKLFVDAGSSPTYLIFNKEKKREREKIERKKVREGGGRGYF